MNRNSKNMEKLLSPEMKRFNYLLSETNSTYHEAALKLGLSDSAMQVLYAICNHGDRCMLSDICKLSGTSKQTINSALCKLEEEDIVYLEDCRGRKKRVCLTQTGQALVEKTVSKIIELENEIFDSWSDSEREIYLELTQRYLSSLREKVKEL